MSKHSKQPKIDRSDVDPVDQYTVYRHREIEVVRWWDSRCMTREGIGGGDAFGRTMGFVYERIRERDERTIRDIWLVHQGIIWNAVWASGIGISTGAQLLSYLVASCMAIKPYIPSPCTLCRFMPSNAPLRIRRRSGEEREEVRYDKDRLHLHWTENEIRFLNSAAGTCLWYVSPSGYSASDEGLVEHSKERHDERDSRGSLKQIRGISKSNSWDRNAQWT